MSNQIFHLFQDRYKIRIFVFTILSSIITDDTDQTTLNFRVAVVFFPITNKSLFDKTKVIPFHYWKSIHNLGEAYSDDKDSNDYLKKKMFNKL